MQRLRVPVELEMSDLVQLYPTDNVMGFHKDKVYFICDGIYRGMEEFNAGNIHPDKKEPFYVPLNTKILRKVLGGNCYRNILDWMKTAGIILPDVSWKGGNVSQGYKFTEYFYDSDITWKTVTCWTLVKKEVCDYIDKKLHFQPAVAKKLKKWFDPKRLKIDEQKAFEVIDLIANSEIIAANDDIEKIRRARINRMANETKVENLINGKYSFTQDPYGYRLHTEFTRLPREFRSLITYDGKQLVEIDISASQLFFSCFLLDFRHWNTPKYKTKTKFIKELWKDITVMNKNNSIEYYDTIMYIKSLETFFGKGFQNYDFLKRCCGGLFYESIVDKLDAENYFPSEFDFKMKREKVKTILLAQLFANEFDKKHQGLFCSKNLPVYNAFAALYPEMARVYQQIKIGLKTSQKQGRYRDLCSLLQRIESIAMQGFVCKQIQDEYPGIPIFTLHDCLITTLENKLLIEQAMKAGIEKYIGFAPKMKTVYWREYETNIIEHEKIAANNSLEFRA